MRILVVAPDCPFPPVGGGQLRIYHCLRALAGRHDLTLVAFDWGRKADPPPFPLRVVEVPWTMPPLYEEMLYGAGEVSRRAHAELARTGEPFLVSYYQSADMEEALRRVTRDPFDLIILENSFMARFLPALPPAVPKVLVLYDVHSRMEMRRAADPGDPEAEHADPERMLAFERWAAGQCALCVAVSQSEADAARSLLGAARVAVVPNGVDTQYFTPAAGPGRPNRLLFTGSMNYWPNVRAVQFFCGEILPLIRARAPEAHLHVVGTSPTPEVRGLASDHVTVVGAVPDMRPHYAEAAVVVVPLRDGGGTRLKILEAAACAGAMVSTTVGAEGLEFCPGRDLLIADKPPAFAEAVLRLLGDEPGRSGMGRAARSAALRYDWETIGAEYRRLVEHTFVTGEAQGGAA
jgi:glycosyltransferase involved in cell wall biosynthesis